MKRKWYAFFTLILSFLLSAVFLCACDNAGKAKASVVETTDTMVVIKVEKVEEETTLTSVMHALQEKGELSFTLSGGMVTEINGKANAADFSACWMLYTSDTELSNSAWGTVEYGGQAMGSAVVGADTLPVKEGAYYIWSYQAF